jgi:hypothetical protein
MKINELNQTAKVNEGALLDILIGPDAAKHFSKNDERHIEALNYFLKDFVGDATTSLANGITGGLVDPSVTRELTLGPKPPTALTEPSDPSGTPPPATPGTPPPATPAPAASSAEQTAAAAQQHRKDIGAAATNMDAGRAAQAKPAFQRTADDKLAMKAAGLSEQNYRALNNIFESIVSTMYEEEEQTTETIGEYMIRWFDTYMEGTNWKTKQGIILPIIKDIEETYNADKGRAAIEKLGRVAWDMLGKAPSVPAGAKDIVPAKTAGAAPSSGKMSTTSEIITAIANLKKTNPMEFNKLSDQLGAFVK